MTYFSPYSCKLLPGHLRRASEGQGNLVNPLVLLAGFSLASVEEGNALVFLEGFS